jgi:hypothetical protein
LPDCSSKDKKVSGIQILLLCSEVNIYFNNYNKYLLFGKRMCSKGIWISRITGIVFVIIGILTISRILTFYNDSIDMNTMDMS